VTGSVEVMGTPAQRVRWKSEENEAQRISRQQRERDAKHQAEQAAAEKVKDEAARENLSEIPGLSESLAAEREAERILKEGRPFDYFIKTYQLDHADDLTVARCMALIFAASAVANGDGLHGIISGKSGGGKSHAASKMIAQLPSRYKFERQFSEKHLFYAGESGGIHEGAVIVIDDKTLSEAVQELLKGYTTNYHNGVTYGTVFNQKAKDLTLPPRISLILLKVDDPGDDQILNRMIQCRVNESEDKIKAASKKIQEKYGGLLKKTVTKDRWEILVCREMWTRIKDQMMAVEVPCYGKVRFVDYDNLRNHEIFFNILMCHTAIHRWQRKEIGKTQDGIPVIQAKREDFKAAVDIYEALFTFGGQRHNTTEPEDKIIRALVELAPPAGHFTINEVATIAGMHYQSARLAIVGRRSANNAETLGGLLQKCPAIQKIGKRGRYELEIERSEIREHSEIIRKEHFNEDVYFVNLDALNSWMAAGSPVALDPGFKWEDE